jgi:polyphosphate kinase
MTRNIDYRVEVLCPVREPRHKALLQAVLDIQWHDNVKARILDSKQRNAMVPRKAKTPPCVPRRRFMPTWPRASCRGCRAPT